MGLDIEQISGLVGVDNRGALLRLQAPLSAAACAPLYPPMEAEVAVSLCRIEGKRTEITVGFIVPEVLNDPVPCSMTVPPGYEIVSPCNFEATTLSLPGGRVFEYLDSTMITDCEIAPGSRTASFIVRTTLRALTVWNYFTVHVRNPGASHAPPNQEQNAWSLIVGGFAAGSVSARGVPSPALHTVTDLELRELPFVYNDTSWAVALTLRTDSAVPPGGYVTVVAPAPFSFPAAQCRGPNATGYAQEAGQPDYVPEIPTQPFQPLRQAADPIRQGPTANLQVLPPQPDRARCDVQGSRLIVEILEGSLSPALYELRFAIGVDPSAAADVTGPGAVEAAFAPARWALESWRPACPESPTCPEPRAACAGACCPERRDNFRVVVGVEKLELLDRGVVEAV